MNFFCFRPNRKDARFNQKAVKQGGKVVNVYDGRDFVQGFIARFDTNFKTLDPRSKDFEWEKLKPFVPNLVPNPKQTTPNAINIDIETKNHLPKNPSLEDISRYNTFQIINTRPITSHTTIHDAKKWNEFVKPLFRGR